MKQAVFGLAGIVSSLLLLSACGKAFDRADPSAPDACACDLDAAQPADGGPDAGAPPPDAGAQDGAPGVPDAQTRQDATPPSEAGMLPGDAGAEAGVQDAGPDTNTPQDASTPVCTDVAPQRLPTDVERERAACLAGISASEFQGPFSHALMREGSVSYWLPSLPDGCRAPVVHFAVGTGASCSSYSLLLERLASHGFLVACTERSQTGYTTAGMEALETVYERFGALAGPQIGTLGHEVGGQSALLTLVQARERWGEDSLYAGFAIAPASGSTTGADWRAAYERIEAPVFMFSGTRDQLVSERWVGRGFEALCDLSEAYHWSAVDAPHIPVPIDFALEAAIPWLRWKLLGDEQACEVLKALPMGDRWTTVSEQHAVGCHPAR